MPEYIDREAVYKMACRGCTRHGDEFGSCYEEEPCEELQSEFASAPAADVEPVRHGSWIPVDNGLHKCNHCHTVRKTDVARDHYCPNCGAKMDEGGNNEKYD